MEDSDLDSLEAYLETLDPGMRKRLRFGGRANIMFPRLKDRVQMKTAEGTVVHRHLKCDCKLHPVFGPPGISAWNYQGMLDTLGFASQENQIEDLESLDDA